MSKALKFSESASILKELLNDIPTAVVILDKNVVIRMHNKAFADIFAESEYNAIGKYCGNAMGCSFAVSENTDCGKSSECPRCNFRNSFIQALVKNEKFKEKISKTYYHRDKVVTKHFYYTTKNIRFEQEDMILVLIDDITELEEKNLILSDLNEKKDMFMRIAAHDIRNPISTIFTISDLLVNSSNEIPTEKKLEFLGYIKASASFSISLLNDLLDFSVLESGNARLNNTPNKYTEQVRQITET